MNYSQITVKTTSQAGELVAYFLQEVCMDGVSIYDVNDLSVANWDYMEGDLANSYDSAVLVKGYCELQETESVVNYLKEQFANLDKDMCGSLEITVDTVDGDSWIAKWKENFQPIALGDVVVCPEWLTVNEQHKDKKVLMLDSGIAFGTGQHETTSMCIELANTVHLTNKSVLDVGCGSGILGLVALLKGAKCATLVDIDSQATEVALHNATINNLEDKATILCGDLTKDVKGTFDVVFANLTADILYLLAKDIVNKVHKGSVIILSGILSDRVDKVIDCYQNIQFRLIKQIDKGEWSAVVMEY